MSAGALALLCAAAGPLPAQKKPPPPPPPAYPLKVGNRWDYRLGKQHVTTRVVKQEAAGKDTAAVLETTGDGKTVLEKLTVRADGVYRSFAEDTEIEPP